MRFSLSFIKRTDRNSAAFIRDESGVTLVEYGIALVLAVSVGGVSLSSLGVGMSTNINDAAVEMAAR